MDNGEEQGTRIIPVDRYHLKMTTSEDQATLTISNVGEKVATALPLLPVN
jgi:hypothetical protein